MLEIEMSEQEMLERFGKTTCSCSSGCISSS